MDKSKQIAIVGVAGRFPDAQSLTEFYKNLLEGRDSVNELNNDRKESTGIDPDKNYQLLGALQSIDTFDHNFFNISKGEAIQMDPHQRLLLETVYHALENTGKPVSTYKGTDTALFMSDVLLNYYTLSDELEVTAFTGNLPSATAGRVARYFDLRGPAMMIDTACSSGLAALYQACLSLKCNETRMAVIAGADLTIVPGEKTREDILGIESSSGKAKAFSSEADGTGAGEAVVAVVLKTLEQAEKDGDFVHAVIRGISANQDAALSSGLTAPDSEAQAALLSRVWEKAEINPETIGFIECHGTGTKLGDPIEVDAINQAFAKYTDKKHFCEISSLKSNIGHTNSVAGLASLIKVILSLRYGKFFPSLHIQSLNPLIDFENSHVQVTSSLKEWETPYNVLRRAGISSFGLVGTNVHVLLEEYRNPSLQSHDNSNRLVCISGATEKALELNLKTWENWLENQQTTMAKLAFSSQFGRDHFDYRASFVADSIESLRQNIASYQIRKAADKQVFFLFSGATQLSATEVLNWMQNDAGIQRFFKEKHQIEFSDNSKIEELQFAAAFYCWSITLAVLKTEPQVLTDGIGNLVLEVHQGERSLQDALNIVSGGVVAFSSVENLRERLSNFVSRFSDNESIHFVEVGLKGNLSDALEGIPRILVAQSVSQNDFMNCLMSALYQLGIWTPEQRHTVCDLPPYTFEPVRCWHKHVKQEHQENRESQNVKLEESLSIEETVEAIWIDVLKEYNISRSDDFFEIGGHSLNGTQVLNRLNETYNIELFIGDFLDYPTIDSLSDFIRKLLEESSGEEKHTIKIAPVADKYPVLFGQKRLWILSQMDGASKAYNLNAAVRLNGVFNYTRFADAIDQLVAKYEILRTNFRLDPKSGDVFQYIKDRQSFTPMCQFTTFEGNGEEDLKTIVLDSIEYEFDLIDGALFKFDIIKIDEQQHVLTFCMHHIIGDDWSMKLFIKQLFECYASTGEATVEQPKFQFKDICVWRTENQSNINQHGDFWRNKFAGDIPVLNLGGYELKRPSVKTFVGKKVHVPISDNDFAIFSQFIHNQQITSFTAIYGLVNLLLYKYTGQPDFVIGVPVAGRNHSGYEDQIGFFVNTLPMRIGIDSTKTLNTFFTSVKQEVFEAFSHQDYPIDKLINELKLDREISRSPLFDIQLTLQNTSTVVKVDKPSQTEEIVLTPFEVETTTSQFDISFLFQDSGAGLHFELEYNTDIFEPEFITEFGQHFVQLMHDVVTFGDTKIQNISLVNESQLKVQRELFDRTGDTFDSSDTIISVFDRSVKKYGDKTAVVYASQSLSYSELDKMSNKVANYLLANFSICKDDRIVVTLPRSEKIIAVLLGILKAGAAYVPIDPEYPVERIEYITEDSKAVTSIDETVLVDIERAATLSDEKPEVTMDPTSVAYIIYTSGTTGKPKGTLVENRNVTRLFHNNGNDFEFADSDVWTMFHSYCFDFSVWEMYGALLFGGKVVVISDDMRKDSLKYLDLLEKEEVTVLNSTPSAFNELQQIALSKGAKLKLKYLIFGGEALFAGSLEAWHLRYPETKLINMFGITETTVHVTLREITQADIRKNSSSIGRPISTTGCEVRDLDGQLVPFGVPGELWVTGEGISRGYFNRNDLTDEKFVQTPEGKRAYRSGDKVKLLPNGNMLYLGRIDNQVKIRGHRIEIEEIEQALESLENVSKGVVNVIESKSGQKLSAYVQGESGLQAEDVKRNLTMILPKFMVPEYITVLSEFPITIHGKVDKKQLPDPLKSEELLMRLIVKPKGEIENKLTSIWNEILDIDEVSTNDNFFEIGGDSLSIIRLSMLANEAFGLEETVITYFQYPTIKLFAEYVKNNTVNNTISNEQLEEFTGIMEDTLNLMNDD
jgi:amino acid adenylation domain-containing protein